MTLQDVEQAAEAVKRAPLSDRALAAASLGEALECELSAPEALRSVSRRIAELADELGCDSLMGASAVGERLAAAAVALSSNGLRLQYGGSGQKVLIVDGLLVTGAQLSEAARSVRKAGAIHTAGAVVLSLNHVDLVDVIEPLVVLATERNGA